jgi:hypothetical protein
MTTDMEADATTYSATYTELAARLGIAVASAKTLTRRHRWQRTKGNDGLTRVLVPIDYLEEERGSESRHGGSHDSLHVSSHESLPDSPQPAPGTIEAIAALERHVARLEADVRATTSALKEAITTADALRAQALTEAVTTAAMKATLEAVSAERDRLLTREHLREQRRWWPFRRAG